MLSNRQHALVDMAELIDQAIEDLFVSAEPPRERLRLVLVWIQKIHSHYAFALLPEGFSDRVKSLEQALTRYGGLERTLVELTDDEVATVLRQFLRVDRFWHREMREILKKRDDGTFPPPPPEFWEGLKNGA